MYKKIDTFPCAFNSSFLIDNMQDPNEDTEWNDILRAKGIIPEKPKEKEINEDEIVAMLEKSIKQKSGSKSVLF